MGGEVEGGREREGGREGGSNILPLLLPPAMLNAVPGIEAVVMTTNGVTLSRKLPQLKGAGLGGVNVSLDTLQPQKFQFITRRQGLARVLDGIHKAVAMEIKQIKV